jgi:ring-1,2-phenylacetyl-CoA epoxidase subunit PaaE
MRRNFALEPSELAAGFVLTCQSLPVTAELTVDYDA